MKKDIVLAVLVLLICACSRSKQAKYVAISEDESDNFQVVMDKKIDSVHPGAGNNQMRKEWKRLNSLCFENKTFSNPVYLGLTNLYGIGTLIDEKQGVILKDLSKIISPQDMSKFVNNNTPFASICDKAKQDKLDVGVALDAVLSKIQDPEIAFKIKKCKDAKVSAGEWRQMNATVGDIIDYVDTSKAPGITNYKKYLDQSGVYMVISTLEVSNFSAELKYDTDLEANISAKFVGDSIKYETPNSIGGSVTIRKTSTKSVSVKCSSLFIPLVVLYKKK